MKAVVVLFTFLFFLYFANSAFAVSVTISDYPGTIAEDSFTITASISGATTGTNYLRIDLFKDGTTNYFGETFNGSDWYGDSVYPQYLPVSIVSGITWSGNIQGRIGSPTSTEYDGSGVYKMRLRRYTSGGGSTATEANNSAVTISISLPTSTPTPTPTSAPTNTPTPTPTSSPTNTPTPSPTPTKTPTPIPTSNTPTSNPTTTSSPENILQNSVLGQNTGNGLAISAPENLIADQTRKPDTLFRVISTVLGIVFIAVCVILTLRVVKKEKLMQDEQEEF